MEKYTTQYNTINVKKTKATLILSLHMTLGTGNEVGLFYQSTSTAWASKNYMHKMLSTTKELQL